MRRYTRIFRNPKETSRGPHKILLYLWGLKTSKFWLFRGILFRKKYLMSLRAKIRGPRGILCTRGEKEYASIRQPTVAYDSRLVKREAYDASPGRDTSLPNDSDMPAAWYCFRSYIVFDSDICPLGKLWIKTATSAASRNITLTKSKYHLRSKYNRPPAAKGMTCWKWGPHKILSYLRGEKAHTSKRVSIIAPIMRFQKWSCAPLGRVTASRTL